MTDQKHDLFKTLKKIDVSKYPDILSLACHDEILDRAIVFANFHHSGQFRKSGEPYITHPLAVAETLVAYFKIKDSIILAASILHDTVEDVPKLSLLDIKNEFGHDIAMLVDACTKLKIFKKKRSETMDMTMRKLLGIVSQKKPESLLIKLGDRLHNMSTMGSMPLKKRQQKAVETLDFYAPLAAKLNLMPIKRDLYDLALKNIFPKKSKKFKTCLSGLKTSSLVSNIKHLLQSHLTSDKYEITIRNRAKGLFSLYSSIKKNLSFENAENLVDFTVVLHTKEPQSCYYALGIVNTLFKPIPKTIRDFIANPKMNGYQSLHVRISQKEARFLIKIRTAEMDLLAQRGLLLYWDDKKRYGSLKDRVNSIFQDLSEYSGSPIDRKKLFQALPNDEALYVFTPNNDIRYLPVHSIVLDFAYSVHTMLGQHCKSALINNKISSVSTRLNDGDQVRIIKSEAIIDVTPDLETKCQTPKAKNAVHQILREKRKTYAIKIGKSILLQSLKFHGISLEILNTEGFQHYLTYRNVNHIHQLYAMIGQDLLSTDEIIIDVCEIKPLKNISIHIRIDNLETSIHKFSKCCHPFPGLANTIAILSKRGIAFHKEDCNVINSKKYLNNKYYNVAWDFDSIWKKPIQFDIYLRQSPINDVLEHITCLPDNLEFNYITKDTKKNRPGTVMSLKLDSFETALKFFEHFCLLLNGQAIEIESFTHS